MDIDLLRRAAAKLRALATPIQPASLADSWCPGYAHAAIRHVERNVDLDIDPCPDHGNDHGMFSRYAGLYVALMHPPVALALADWLDLQAQAEDGRVEQEQRMLCQPGVLMTHRDEQAYAVARAVLREDGV